MKDTLGLDLFCFYTTFVHVHLYIDCMVSLPEELELYQKHVQCYYPLKVESMKCFVRHPPPKKEEGMLDREK